MPRPRVPLRDRFWQHVHRADPDACWPWLGQRNNRGYGRTTVGHDRRLAHRVAYELVHGAIPAGKVIDHLCHDPAECAGGSTCPHRACCNPAHLAPSDQKANILRGSGLTARNAAKTHCPKGHPFDEANTCHSGGARYCRACAREKAARRSAEVA